MTTASRNGLHSLWKAFLLAVHWRFLKKTASGNSIFTGGSRIPASENRDFHWPLALAALKRASANVSRTATIEALCTSEKLFTHPLSQCRIEALSALFG
jgi:hypothetical protein